MSIWKSKEWKKYYLQKAYIKGIKINFDKDVNEDVKRAIKEIMAWLRTQYEFPKRLHIYVKKSLLVRARDGDKIPDLFFWPDSRDGKPYIKIATGDYPELLENLGRDNALATILFALLEELTHYFQWLNGMEFQEEKLKKQANRCARQIMNAYAETRDHP